MEDWTKYFDDLTLKRGEEYFNKGKVKGFTKTKDGCMARVLGTHIYNVRIWGLKSGRMAFSCDCSFSKMGFTCKHAAAVMHYLDDLNNPKGTETEEYKYESDKGKTYFNVRAILEFNNISDSKIKNARDLITKGLIELSHVDDYYVQSYGRTDYQYAVEFNGIIKDGARYGNGVRIILTKNSIFSSSCDYPHKNAGYYGYYSSSYRNVCEHQVALLLLADAFIAKYNPGDDTDFTAAKILTGYKKMTSLKKIDETVDKSRTIRLVPRLYVEGSLSNPELSVSFKIGTEKLYVLKSLNELVKTKNKRGSMKFGKNYILSFMDNDFNEESERYYRLIEDAKKEADYLKERFSRCNFIDDDFLKDRVTLSPELMDKFYDIAKGETIELNYYKDGDGKEINKLKIDHSKVNASVSIENLTDEDDNFSGVMISAKLPVVFKGRNCDYSIDDNNAVLTRMDTISSMMKLLMDNSEGGYSEFIIGKKKLSEFYYRFLPQLMESPDIEVREDNREALSRYLPKECEITFFLDADEDYILGHVQAAYGEEEITLHKLRDSDYPLPENRDNDYEQSAVELLQKYLPDVSADGENLFCEKSADNVFDLLSEGLSDLMGIGEVRASREFERLKLRKAPKVRLGVSVESGILNLDISTDDMSEDELLELLESYRKKKKYFRLKSGEFISLDKDDALEELIMTMQTMGISAKEFTKGKLHLPLYRAIYVNKLLEEHDEIAAERDKNFKNLVRNFNAVRDADVEAPESLKKILRGYQTYGFKWLNMLSELHFGGILADDMGLGKTLQMITFLLYKSEQAKEAGAGINALIVCPASLVYNWEAEFNRFAPSMEVVTVTGTQAERKKILNSQKMPEILITSYDLLKRDIGFYEDLSFDYEIIDEAQYIKNSSAAASKTVKIIKSTNRFALTGTPIENRLSELWSIFDYLMPGFLYSYERFKDDFETAITKFKDEDATRQLRNMVGPFILRRLKENVLKDLPDKMEEIRYSRFDNAQRKLYDAQVTHMKKVLESDDYQSGKDKLKVLAELTRIRQICCDPALITEGYTGASAKRESCIELIESAIDGGHKILLFSQFTTMLELLEADLNKKGIKYYKITGQTPKEERLKLVNKFNNNDVPLFLISLKAGGTGLNLVGADVVIHYDPWWNLAAQNQATDRAHRIGQTKKVSVFKLIAKGTIEEKIIDMQNAKKDLADAILSGETESLSNLTKEQLMELLG